MPRYTLSVNQISHQVDVDADTPLLWVLRDELGLVGTKFGCGVAMCGACTVHVNGSAMRSCQLPVSAVGENAITTIEGLSENGEHPVQKAWLEHDVAQCGYCQSGQIMQAAALLKENPKPSDHEILEAMAGNVCRCGCYQRIVVFDHDEWGFPEHIYSFTCTELTLRSWGWLTGACPTINPTLLRPPSEPTTARK